MSEIPDILCDQVINQEVLVSESNQEDSNSEFEQCMDLLAAERREKDYDWMSDIRIPEFASHMLTQSSLDVGQYFQTREFVSAYLEEGSEFAKKNAAAATELINRTLNQRHLHHYLKFIRAKGINNLIGRVYAKAWWEQKTETKVVGTETKYETLNIDVDGNPIESEFQVPAVASYEEDVEGEVPIVDRFNYDVWDQRNVFTDNSYVYSIQDKQWVTFRSEMTLEELEIDAEKNGYFNLDKLADIEPPSTTKFKSEAADKDQNFNPVDSAVQHPYDIYERYGKYWILPDKEGEAAIGLDVEGEPLKKAVFDEVIITIAVSGDKKVPIGFKLTPYVDASGFSYRPILRGLCYINLTEDGGLGDGKYSKELQIAIDDTFNISQDRVMLATLPTLKTNKMSIQDNSTIYFEPGHNMLLNDPKDVEEFKISDNITGALQQMTMLTDKMQQVDSIQPPQMGDTGAASTTATAFAGAFRATGERTNYKSLTFENTFLCDLYWMIQQMTMVFAKPETGVELMGDRVYDFAPDKDYWYKAVSQSIEPEHSKAAKRNELSTIIGYLGQIAPMHPDGVRIFNYALSKFFMLFGDEYSDISDKLLDEKTPIRAEQGGVGMVPGAQGGAVSNQNMVPMSAPEEDMRGLANIGAF